DKNIFDIFDDKNKFYNYMKNNQFDMYIPKFWNINSNNLVNIQLPCILKYNKSYYGRETFIINTLNDIPMNTNPNDYSLCEIIEGETEYATHIFAINGEIIIDVTIKHNFDK